MLGGRSRSGARRLPFVLGGLTIVLGAVVAIAIVLSHDPSIPSARLVSYDDSVSVLRTAVASTVPTVASTISTVVTPPVVVAPTPAAAPAIPADRSSDVTVVAFGSSPRS